MLGSIHQKTLHNRRFRYADHVGAGSVFPLFDDNGKTQALMVTSTVDDQLIVIDYDLKLFVGRTLLPSLWPQRVQASRNALLLRESTSQGKLASLWHFDPWWVLADSRYAGHGLVPALKETNIPGFDGTLTGVWFSPNLSRVTWVAITPEGSVDVDGSGSNVQVRRFKPHFLDTASRARTQKRAEACSPSARADRSEGHRRGAWVLNPFWQR